MKYFRYILSSIILSIFYPNISLGQIQLTNASLAEKIYLQLDKNIYGTGSTIWFKSIVTTSFNNNPTNLSSVLYVELIRPDKAIIEKKLIKLEKGIGNGYFDLAETLQAGNYLIRAYTEWNKNFGSDFIFQTGIQIFSIYDKIDENIENVELSYIPLFNNDNIDSSKNQDIDLQFLPESGEMVDGLRSKIGFKALDANGNGILVEGFILDDDDNSIATFKSNALGMGSLEIKNPNKNKTYKSKLSNNAKVYPLPAVASLGNILAVSEKDKNIQVKVQSNYLENDSINLNVVYRGTIIHELKAALNNGNLKFLFSSNELPEGVIVFKLMNGLKQPLCERLFFNQKLESQLKMNISIDKLIYTKRALVNLSIETLNKNTPIAANTSLLVIDKKELGFMQQSRTNIMSYFLLSSELNGYVENPRYYFDSQKNTQQDLDALMLTQGWRQYKYTKSNKEFRFKPETFLKISGKATSKTEKNNGGHLDLTMMTFGKNHVLYTQTTDSLGHFSFELDDEFGNYLDVIIQSANVGRKKVDYNFEIYDKESPPISYNYQTKIEYTKEEIAEFIKKDIDRSKKVEGDFYQDPSSINLDEVLITGRNLTPTQQKVIKRFGEPDKIIDGEELQEKEKKWSSGIFDILHFSFRDKVRIVNGDTIVALNLAPTMVVVDGIPVYPYQYGNLKNIPTSEVTSIEVIELAKSFRSFCIQIFPDEWRKKCMDPKKGPQGNIIAIYTKTQQGINGAYTRQPKELSKTTIPVFNEGKEFYSPKYDKILSKDQSLPDLRTVLFWQPILKTDDSGIAKTSFYNSDIIGEVMVVVEAITEDGSIAYEELNYKVQ